MTRKYYKGLVFIGIAVCTIVAAYILANYVEVDSEIHVVFTAVTLVVGLLAAVAEFTGFNLRDIFEFFSEAIPKKK